MTRRSWIALLVALAAACPKSEGVPPDAAAPAKDPVLVEVLVDGEPAAPWTLGALESQQPWSVTGGASRKVWSLELLAGELVGPEARVVALHGEDGRLALPEEQWNDQAAAPALRLNRRGSLKFQWVDAETGRPVAGRAELHGVRKIEVTRKQRQR